MRFDIAFTLGALLQLVSHTAAQEDTSLDASPDDIVLNGKRQIAPGGGAAAAPTVVPQAGVVTTLWPASGTVIGGVTQITYPEVIYTQTFPSTPGQLAGPGSGAIGYGTLTKAKRDLPTEAIATGVAGRIRL